MGLRETMNNNPAAVTGGAVVVLILCLVLVYCQFVGGGSSPSGKAQIIYYDVESKTIKLVAYDYTSIPDSPLADQPNAYEATVFACGECPEDALVDGMSLDDLKSKGMFIGWLQKRDPGTDPDPSFNPTVKYRPFKSKTWMSGDSEKWYAMEDKIQRQCQGGEYAMACYAPLLE